MRITPNIEEMVRTSTSMFYAKAVADSIFTTRLTSLEVRYPRFILAEMNTHRVFSRNTASSRAIPIAKMLAQVEETPYIPSEIYKNQPGMSGTIKLEGGALLEAQIAWYRASQNAVMSVKPLADLGVHKQHANRLLEPFSWTTQLITSTDWDNFFELRCHPTNPQPEMTTIANMMSKALGGSSPRKLTEHQVHLPYVTESERTEDIFTTITLSVARCARVSYLNQEGTVDRTKDFQLARNLAFDKHWSPMEHQAEALINYTEKGNFRHWKQLRHALEEKGAWTRNLPWI